MLRHRFFIGTNGYFEISTMTPAIDLAKKKKI
ncbi:Cys-tRNA(Pro) deacylase, partial [Vibrio anguillarum]|nr:Cys-tRNA(Pro) deacylase [Vibrio anguillarum]